jgi:hypothetical protein
MCRIVVLAAESWRKLAVERQGNVKRDTRPYGPALSVWSALQVNGPGLPVTAHVRYGPDAGIAFRAFSAGDGTISDAHLHILDRILRAVL